VGVRTGASVPCSGQAELALGQRPVVIALLGDDG
jgi:hypothetical protein